MKPNSFLGLVLIGIVGSFIALFVVAYSETDVKSIDNDSNTSELGWCLMTGNYHFNDKIRKGEILFYIGNKHSDNLRLAFTDSDFGAGGWKLPDDKSEYEVMIISHSFQGTNMYFATKFRKVAEKNPATKPKRGY